MKPLVLFLVTLAGCSGGHDLADLETYVEQVRAGRVLAVHPLPRLPEPQPFAYRAGGARSPFAPWQPLEGSGGPPAAGRVVPDFERPKQALEQYPIGAIDMVGTLSGGSVRYGLVRSADGMVRRVAIGDYLGEDHGRVREIGPRGIELVEIVADGTGGWVERDRVIAIVPELPQPRLAEPACNIRGATGSH